MGLFVICSPLSEPEIGIARATEGRMMFESLKEKFMIVTADGKKDKLLDRVGCTEVTGGSASDRRECNRQAGVLTQVTDLCEENSGLSKRLCSARLLNCLLRCGFKTGLHDRTTNRCPYMRKK